MAAILFKGRWVNWLQKNAMKSIQTQLVPNHTTKHKGLTYCPFERAFRRSPEESPHREPVMRRVFACHDVLMMKCKPYAYFLAVLHDTHPPRTITILSRCQLYRHCWCSPVSLFATTKNSGAASDGKVGIMTFELQCCLWKETHAFRSYLCYLLDDSS